MRNKSLIITGCFFLSGLAGLIYEVVWARQLGLFLGITSYAHTAVITAYMAGLAAGSFYFGRHADQRSQPLKTYAWLEIGVGLYAALTPWLFTLLQVLYVDLSDVSHIGEMRGHLSRFVIAMLALLIPTFMMGGTLPLLVRGFTRVLPDLGKTTSRLYGINTLGAMLGTVLAGFILLPTIGVTATIFVGVIINLGIAVVVLAILRRVRTDHSAHDAQPVPQAAPHQPLPDRSRIVVLVAFATAGFAALLTQMAWIRALILVVGGSVYAFTITLASFLAGIGLGSLLYARYASKTVVWLSGPMLRERMVQAALLALMISLTLLLGLPLIGKLPAWFLAGYAAGLQDYFALFQLFIFSLSFGVMIAPTLLMGVMFPLVTVIWTRSISHAGRGVGAAYATNTSGTILGALLGGLLILPWLGIHDSVRLAAALYFLVAAGFWLFAVVGIKWVGRLVVAGFAGLLIALIAWHIPPWDKAMMVSGAFSRPDNMNMAMREQPDRSLKQIIDDYELLYYDEGPDGTVAVRKKRDNVNSQKTLVINGKADASSIGDMPTQILLAQLPLAINPKAEKALVIGLGSGITAGSLSKSKSLNEMTILEISHEVIEASTFFEPENYGVLADPRVNLVTADARNYLMSAPQHYDLIISEPSNPWISGVANLFTDEFLKLAKSRLSPGGVMTQWFHIYSMSDADLKTMLKTFDDNFAHVSVWRIQAGDLALIGSDQPHAISLAHIGTDGATELARGKVRHDRDLAGLYIFGGELLSRYAEGSPTNRDNMPVIEFSAPRNLYSITDDQNINNIFAYLKERKLTVPMTDMVTQTDEYLSVPFMSLRIAGKDNVFSQVSTRWLIDRPRVQMNGLSIAGLGSERLLDWMEGNARFQVQAVRLATATSAPGLQDLLNQLTLSTGRQSGDIQLADETDAIWLMDVGGGVLPLQFDIAWDCPGHGPEFSRYALHAALPDPGEDARRNVLTDLVGRISCDASRYSSPSADS
jgi:spermidine synthase